MQTDRKLLIRLSVVVLLISGSTVAAPVNPTHAQHAIVASVHELASRAGVEIMRQGGNAVDAAVATGFALAVVHPQAGNLGGGGFMLIRMADGKSHFIDYREKAPAAATANMYLDAEGNVIPDASVIGYKAIGVPGSVAGLVYAEKSYGKLTLDKVMAQAIKLARDGFVLSWEDAHDFGDRHLAEFPESRRIFQRDGNYYRPGEVFRQPELANTLERIAARPDDFYRGNMARDIAAAVQKGGGLITADDLTKYEVKEREPVRGTYRGYEIISSPPPSSGGIALIEILNVLEGYPLSQYGRSAEATHLTLEAFRRAYFDRAEFLGDPDFSKIPTAQLIDKKYGAAWRQTIDPDRATPTPELKRPSVFNQLDTYAATHPQPAVRPEPNHTTHYSVVDSAGDAVAVTTTLNDSFGSRVTVPGLGFLLNDEMDDFASKPGTPNIYGLIQGPANAVGPGKRPLSSMTPTIVAKDGKPFLVLGSPGGGRIITTVANILMDVVDYGMDIQTAVNERRFHHQAYPDIAYFEQWFSPDTVAMLKKMGYEIKFGAGTGDDWEPYWSDGECVQVDLKTGERLGASDTRNNGKAVGY
jgi:gamma-glutamyltranspeptidase/glutathione hydrolase